MFLSIPFLLLELAWLLRFMPYFYQIFILLNIQIADIWQEIIFPQYIWKTDLIPEAILVNFLPPVIHYSFNLLILVPADDATVFVQSMMGRVLVEAIIFYLVTNHIRITPADIKADGSFFKDTVPEKMRETEHRRAMGIQCRVLP